MLFIINKSHQVYVKWSQMKWNTWNFMKYIKLQRDKQQKNPTTNLLNSTPKSICVTTHLPHLPPGSRVLHTHKLIWSLTTECLGKSPSCTPWTRESSESSQASEFHWSWDEEKPWEKCVYEKYVHDEHENPGHHHRKNEHLTISWRVTRSRTWMDVLSELSVLTLQRGQTGWRVNRKGSDPIRCQRISKEHGNDGS